MPSEPPDPDAGTPAGADLGAGFEVLAQRAAAAAERGAARQRDLDAGTQAAAVPPDRRRAPTLALVALVLVVFAAGGATGWITRGGSTSDNAAAPVTTTPSVPATVTTAVAPTTVTPSTAAPSTSAPSSATTAPPATAPSTDTPTPIPPEGAPEAPMQHTVSAGESFWAIAEAEVARVTQHQPDLSQVDSYWRALVRANAERLVHPGNPDLVYPGQVLVLPVPGSP